MEEVLNACPNCDKLYNPEYNFCPFCGQKTDERITLKNLFYNTITNYFSFDARFFKSFIPLLFRPGYLPRKFVEGKRLLYLHPAQMYLFISVLFFFLFSFIQREQENKFNKVLGDAKAQIHHKDSTSAPSDSIKSLQVLKVEKARKRADSITANLTQNSKQFGLTDAQERRLDSISSDDYGSNNFFSGIFGMNEAKMDSLIQTGATDAEILRLIGVEKDAGYFKTKFYTQMLKFYKNWDGGSILRTFYDAIPITMFFLLPIFSLLIYLFYIRKGSFTHHLIFSFYYFSFLFAVFAILVGINLIYDIPDWIDWLIILSTFFYLYAALKNFYRQGWFVTFFKTSFISFLFLMIVLPLAAGLVITYAFLFY